MGISSCCIALLIVSLELLVDLGLDISMVDFDRGDSLTVRIRKNEPREKPEITAVDEPIRSLAVEQEIPDELVEVQRERSPSDHSGSAAELRLEKDWQAIVKEAAQASVASNFEKRESEALLWQQSRSIMFQPAADNMVVANEAPFLTDIPFIRHSRVFGLGFNIGTCFFGVPIAGVPVEDRSVAIPIFVCTSGF